MTNTHLIDIIRAFSPSKRQEIALFLTSEHFNRGKYAREISRLYQVVIDAVPDFSDKLLNKERVYLLVFLNERVVPGTLEKVISELNKLLRNYALMDQYFSESNEPQQQIDWIRWLRVNNLTGLSQKATEKLRSKKRAQAVESLDQYRADFLIEEELHEWESVHNRAKGDLNIRNLIYRFDLFCQNYRIELSNRYLLQQKAAQLPDWESIEIGARDCQENNLILQLSKTVHRMLIKEHPSVGEVQELIQLLSMSENRLSFQTLAQFYAYLRSICTLLINSGNVEFFPIIHEIHKENLNRGYFFVKGKLSPNVYLNLITASIRAKDYRWATDFTEGYRQQVIGGDEGGFFYYFNKARCLFAEERFDEALSNLPEVISSSHYHPMIRRLELKLYYELHSDLLLYKIDAFRKFIVRTATKTIAANLRTMDLNFLNILTQLTQTPPKDKARSARLLTRIDGKKLLAERAWLIEKAKELG